jgi:hypothetical protein
MHYRTGGASHATCSFIMRSFAISGLILAAAASVVSAAPGKDETGERVSYSRERAQTSTATPEGAWVEIASATPASHGREYITVEGRFGLLRVDAATGRPVLKSVRVVYSDGKERVVRMERALGGKRATAIIQLSGSLIDHVVVNTDPKSKGSYVVQGAPVGGGVASR